MDTLNPSLIHYYRHNPFFIRSMIPTKVQLIERQAYPTLSQSLFHQVNDSNNIMLYTTKVLTVNSHNPFFIRSMIPTHGWWKISHAKGILSQSLFHQVNDSNFMKAILTLVLGSVVTIPFSSGQWFQPKNLCRQLSLIPRHNPFFIRSMIPTEGRKRNDNSAESRHNPFFIRSMIPTIWKETKEYVNTRKSQSLFHQVNDSNTIRGWRRV